MIELPQDEAAFNRMLMLAFNMGLAAATHTWNFKPSTKEYLQCITMLREVAAGNQTMHDTGTTVAHSPEKVGQFVQNMSAASNAIDRELASRIITALDNMKMPPGVFDEQQ